MFGLIQWLVSFAITIAATAQHAALHYNTVVVSDGNGDIASQTGAVRQAHRIRAVSQPMPVKLIDEHRVAPPRDDVQGGVAGSCGSPDAGSCCVIHGSPFCDDEKCCNAVCAVDPFCCDPDGFWSAACRDLAKGTDESPALCPHLCGPPSNPQCGVPGSGSCCDPSDTPGCEDMECCELVCYCDPFCCAFKWDYYCVNPGFSADSCPCGPGMCNVKALCPDLCVPEICGDPLGVSCCGANVVDLQEPGCQDADCCTLVCDSDPFCCGDDPIEGGTWDYLCALSANDLCGCGNALYSNIDTFSGFGFTGATQDPSGLLIVADLLQMVQGGVVHEVTFSMINFSGQTLVDVELDLVFMPAEFVDGELQLPDPDHPSAMVVPVEGLGINLPSAFSMLAMISDDAGFFDTKDNGGFPLALWAGLRYRSAVFSAPANIALLGQMLMSPPAVGFSDDFYWHEVKPGVLPSFGGCPPMGSACANFAWELVGVPGDVVEPCGNPAAGDCFTATPNVSGCSDEACCELVCACDPFCCAGSWDTSCVGPNAFEPGCSANDLCGAPPAEGACTTSIPAPCPADITNSGSVGVPDLLELLGCWGPLVPGGGCEDADLTDSKTVGVPDLLVLLNNWGECPPPVVECMALTESGCKQLGGDYEGDGSACP